jgi:hypothetical protein
MNALVHVTAGGYSPQERSMDGKPGVDRTIRVLSGIIIAFALLIPPPIHTG